MDFLSNFYRVYIIHFGVKLQTAEAHYQLAKVTTLLSFVAPARIRIKGVMESSVHTIKGGANPAKCKELGRKALAMSEKNAVQIWDLMKTDVMFTVLSKKFATTGLINQLTQTNPKTLVEVNPHDQFWGAGADEETLVRREADIPQWANKCGKILQHLRCILLNESKARSKVAVRLGKDDKDQLIRDTTEETTIYYIPLFMVPFKIRVWLLRGLFSRFVVYAELELTPDDLASSLDDNNSTDTTEWIDNYLQPMVKESGSATLVFIKKAGVAADESSHPFVRAVENVLEHEAARNLRIRVTGSF